MLSISSVFSDWDATVFASKYRLGEVMGFGAFSTVRAAVDRETGKEWACKIVTEDAEKELILEEVTILRQLRHPNIVEYREHFDTSEGLFIITEKLCGPNLLSALVERGSYSEEDTCEVVRQLLSALAYLDSKGIAHRDLKAENIMLVSETDHTTLKIIDFGLAGQLSSSSANFMAPCGTPTYLAPEIANGLPYGTACDVWAVGVLVFLLLSGDIPFDAPSVSSLMNCICTEALRFKDPVWELHSARAMALNKRLLSKEPSRRPTAREALHDPWLRE
jgi:serine/threonine protein kinase